MSFSLRDQIIANARGIYQGLQRSTIPRKNSTPDQAIPVQVTGTISLDVLLTQQDGYYIAILVSKEPTGQILARSTSVNEPESALRSLLMLTAERLNEEFGDVFGKKTRGWVMEREESDDEGEQENSGEKTGKAFL